LFKILLKYSSSFRICLEKGKRTYSAPKKKYPWQSTFYELNNGHCQKFSIN
jgi:hypothetical protein